jgi:hypothetical protein
MKRIIFYFTILLLISPSCKEKYETDVDGILNTPVTDHWSDYFSFVGMRINSEADWTDFDGTALPPGGYNYGHKIYKDFLPYEVDNWNYAKMRSEKDPDFMIIITTDTWQKIVGKRKTFRTDIVEHPEKLYDLFEDHKKRLQKLAKVKGTVLMVFNPDPMAHWSGKIIREENGDPHSLPAKIKESKHPDALELNPPQTFAGIWQVMDYMRRKYAPNVMMSYTLKQWGSMGIADEEPAEGWDNNEGVQKEADYLNSYGVQWDVITFNFNPTWGKHTDDQYKSIAKYFGAVARKLHNKDNKKVKTYIWKVSMWPNLWQNNDVNKWNPDHTSFIFRNVDYLVNECETIGATLGYGNEYKAGFDEFGRICFPPVVYKWMREYYFSEDIDVTPHATKGKVHIPK